MVSFVEDHQPSASKVQLNIDSVNFVLISVVSGTVLEPTETTLQRHSEHFHRVPVDNLLDSNGFVSPIRAYALDKNANACRSPGRLLPM